MERETRYIVLKLKDIEAATQGNAAFMQFNEVCDAVTGYRATQGKPPLCCVVVEADWPEYETVWAMIEARMNKEEQNNGQ